MRLCQSKTQSYQFGLHLVLALILHHQDVNYLFLSLGHGKTTVPSRKGIKPMKTTLKIVWQTFETGNH